MVWDTFLDKTKALKPHALLTEALPHAHLSGAALDLGCGAGRDALFLSGKGYDVTAVDSNEKVREFLEGIPFVCSTFADFDYGDARFVLVNAQYALPFNPPETFDDVFGRLTRSLMPQGIFVGQFFGPHDEWAGKPNMTFKSLEQVETLLEPYDVLTLREEDKDGPLAAGGTKHWHVFHIIARKV